MNKSLKAFLFKRQAKTFKGKVTNILLGWLFCFVYITFIFTLLEGLYKGKFPLQLGYDEPSRLYVFFFSCIWAPLWEEAAFRVAPIAIAKHFNRNALMIPVVILSSVLFGWGHGMGPISLLIQGVMGLVFATVYIKNGYSYWSSVTLHFLWNFFLFSGFDWLVKHI